MAGTLPEVGWAAFIVDRGVETSAPEPQAAPATTSIVPVRIRHATLVMDDSSFMAPPIRLTLSMPIGPASSDLDLIGRSLGAVPTAIHGLTPFAPPTPGSRHEVGQNLIALPTKGSVVCDHFRLLQHHPPMLGAQLNVPLGCSASVNPLASSKLNTWPLRASQSSSVAPSWASKASIPLTTSDAW